MAALTIAQMDGTVPYIDTIREFVLTSNATVTDPLGNAKPSLAAASNAVAQSAAGQATVARIAAEAARDGTFARAPVYTSQALAQADTALANGAQYQVVAADAQTVSVYTKINSSSSSAELSTLATGAALGFAQQAAERFAYGGQVLTALADSADRAVAVWLLDGVLRGKLGLVVAPTAALSLTFSATDGLTTLDSAVMAQADDAQFVAGQACVGALTDNAGRAYLAMLQSGKTYIPRLTTDSFNDAARQDVAESADYLFADVAVDAAQQITRTAKLGGAVVQITGTGSNAAPSLSSDGTRVLYTSTRTTPPSLYTQPVGGGLEQPVQSSRLIVALGNSISIATGYISAFATLRPLDTVAAQGVSGQRTDDIAYRFGATALTLSVAGASIPASGAVVVTGLDTTLFRRTSGTAAVRATVEGVPGVLSLSAAVARFTRDSAGVAVPVTNPVASTITSGIVDGSTNASAQLDLGVLQSATVLLVAASYNDIREATYSQAATLANMAALVATLKPLVKRIIIAGDMQGQGRLTAAQFPAGPDPAPDAATSQLYIQRSIALNAALGAAYPQAYIDLHAALVTAGHSSVFNVNSTNYNIINLTVLPDGVHPSGSGIATVAGIINNTFTSRGW
jgi:WD40-like Beta Propeller Repeat